MTDVLVGWNCTTRTRFVLLFFFKVLSFGACANVCGSFLFISIINSFVLAWTPKQPPPSPSPSLPTPPIPLQPPLSPSWDRLLLWMSAPLWRGRCRWSCFRLSGWTSGLSPAPWAGGAWGSGTCPRRASPFPERQEQWFNKVWWSHSEVDLQDIGPLINFHYNLTLREWNLNFSHTDE